MSDERSVANIRRLLNQVQREVDDLAAENLILRSENSLLQEQGAGGGGPRSASKASVSPRPSPRVRRNSSGEAAQGSPGSRSSVGPSRRGRPAVDRSKFTSGDPHFPRGPSAPTLKPLAVTDGTDPAQEGEPPKTPTPRLLALGCAAPEPAKPSGAEEVEPPSPLSPQSMLLPELAPLAKEATMASSTTPTSMLSRWETREELSAMIRAAQTQEVNGYQSFASDLAKSAAGGKRQASPQDPDEQQMARRTSRGGEAGEEDERLEMELWGSWADALVSSGSRKLRNSQSSIADVANASTRRIGEALQTTSSFQRFIFRPSSPKRIVWDFLSVVVMLYDVVAIPLQVFALEQTQGEFIANIATTCFWSTDIILSFCAGYHVEGLIEMRPSKVVCHYMRTWFTVDLFVVGIDWAVLMYGMNDVEGVGLVRLNKTIRFVRILRVLRLLRLLRMLKVMTVMSELYDMIHSEFLITSLGILQFVLGILLVNHYFACLWYGVGAHTSKDEPGRSWVSTFRASHRDSFEGEDPSVAYAYLTSLHWSLTQFTPASMEVVPHNSLERIYAICVLLCAMLLFSSLLSSITTSMIALRAKSTERRRQQSMVRRYITDNRVTLELGNRIAGFLRQHNYNVTSRRSVHEADINAFKILPESLRLMLRFQVYSPSLTKHPLFREMADQDDQTLFSVCNTCITEQGLASGQEKFAAGQPCSHMLILIAGSARYYHGFNPGPEDETEVNATAILCEGVLWMPWETRGRLVGTRHCELLAISSAVIRTLLRRAPLSFNSFRAYAQEYFKRVRRILEETSFGMGHEDEALSDLNAPPLLAEDVMQAIRMSPEMTNAATSVNERGLPKFGSTRSSGSSKEGKMTTRIANWFHSKTSGDTSHHDGPHPGSL